MTYGFLRLLFIRLVLQHCAHDPVCWKTEMSFHNCHLRVLCFQAAASSIPNYDESGRARTGDQPGRSYTVAGAHS